jgi:SAM-dependent methyltransferase
MNHVNCNYCGRDDTELVNSGPDLLLNRPGDFGLVRCRNCGLIYQNPRLAREELLHHYPDSYLLYTTQESEETSALQRLSQQHGLARRCQRVKRHAPTPGKLLDIGCSTGHYLAAMRERGWQVAGVELSEYAASYARQNFNLDVRTGTLHEAGFTDDQFDLVTLWDVFEHVLDPKATLAEIARILKPGGLVVISSPNPTGIEARLFGSSWVGWERPRHLHLFTPDVLRRYLHDAGFSLRSIESFSGRLSVTLLSVEFMLKAHGIPEGKFRPWLKAAYNWPLRLLTWPLYRLGEAFNKTTGMTAYAHLV